MWHASAAPLPGAKHSKESLAVIAKWALSGVGNPLREWREWTGRAYHIRRRLTAEEQERVGQVKDLRGTPEAKERFQSMEMVLPEAARMMAVKEIE